MSDQRIFQTRARNRVMRHLRTLLKASAVTGTGLLVGNGSACVPGEGPPRPSYDCTDYQVIASVRDSVLVQASWQEAGDAGAGVVAAISIADLSGMLATDLVEFFSNSATGGTVLHPTHQDYAFSCIVVPDPGASIVDMPVSATCSIGSTGFTVRLHVGGPRVVGQAIPNDIL